MFGDAFEQRLVLGPGEQAQIPHRDDVLFPWPHPGAEFLINAMWAVDDFTADNGGTCVWPGSHLQPPFFFKPDYDKVLRARMPRGSVLVYLGSTVHGGGANVSAKARTGLVISYSLGWLRQFENQYLAYPPEIAKTLPPQLQDLIGYSIHRPNLGWYEGQEPKVLFEGRPDALAAKDYLPVADDAFIREFYD